MRKRAILASSVIASMVAAVATAQVEDPIVGGEAMVRVADPVSLGVCLAALSAEFPNVQVIDSIESRQTYLIGYELGRGQTPLDVEAVLLQLTAAQVTLWGELNYLGQASEGRTDSLWVSQVDIGAPSYGTQYPVDLLGLDGAHQLSTGLGVVVAVLDTGVDASHPVLAGAMQPGGANFATAVSPYSDVGDRDDNDGDLLFDEMVGHGTFVAGLIHLVAPDARILPITVLDSDGIGTSWSVAKGLYHAIDHGARVVNMSLGSTYHAAAVEDAAAEAMAKGIVVVGAAGNLNLEDPREYPACDSSALGVAATDHLDIKAPFSNFNDKLDLAAPGHSQTLPDDPTLFDPALSIVSTVPGGGYAVWRGTSFSTAFVAGAAALIRAQHPDWPSATTPVAAIVPAIWGTLATTAVPLDDQNPAYKGLLGAGRLDCMAATLVGPPQPAPGDLDGDRLVGPADLSILLGDWGSCGEPCPADFDLDGVVGPADLAILLGHWG